MNRQQAFEAIYAKQHDVPAESLVQYRHKSKDGYNLPGIASHYRTYCEVMDSEEIQALRKDAERYRFLMKSSGSDESHLEPGFYVIYEDGRGFGDIFIGEEASAEIDAAMSKGIQP